MDHVVRKSDKSETGKAKGLPRCNVSVSSRRGMSGSQPEGTAAR